MACGNKAIPAFFFSYFLFYFFIYFFISLRYLPNEQISEYPKFRLSLAIHLAELLKIFIIQNVFIQKSEVKTSRPTQIVPTLTKEGKIIECMWRQN